MNPTTQVQKLLGLRARPVAVAFRHDPPEAIAPFGGRPQPAGCAFWHEAAVGHTFYTVQADHHNCAVGCHTHKIPLPASRTSDLTDAVTLMTQSGYVAMAEIPSIPTLTTAPNYVVYGPADPPTFAPDVVVVAGRGAQLMLLNEACIKAGAHSGLAQTLGRPGCAALPLTLQSGASTLSFGCKGNRLFSGLPDDELYLAVPGPKWEAVAAALPSVLSANAVMAQHYEQRLT